MTAAHKHTATDAMTVMAMLSVKEKIHTAKLTLTLPRQAVLFLLPEIV
jgi:hypothetical protein